MFACWLVGLGFFVVFVCLGFVFCLFFLWRKYKILYFHFHINLPSVLCRFAHTRHVIAVSWGRPLQTNCRGSSPYASAPRPARRVLLPQAWSCWRAVPQGFGRSSPLPFLPPLCPIPFLPPCSSGPELQRSAAEIPSWGKCPKDPSPGCLVCCRGGHSTITTHQASNSPLQSFLRLSFNR